MQLASGHEYHILCILFPKMIVALDSALMISQDSLLFFYPTISILVVRWYSLQPYPTLRFRYHPEHVLTDATVSAPANQTRALFAIIIVTCHPSNPTALWEKYMDEMEEDILHRVHRQLRILIFEIKDEMSNEALVLIRDMCVLMYGSLLSTLGMPVSNCSTHDAFNRELQREKDYVLDEQAERFRTNVPQLNAEQKNVYDSLMKVVDNGSDGINFLNALDLTGKRWSFR